MTALRLVVPSDLTEGSLEGAFRQLHIVPSGRDNSRFVLVASQSDAFEAGRLAERFSGLRVVIVPDEMLASGDAWCLSAYPAVCAWSPGA
jgi:hypothetical protein